MTGGSAAGPPDESPASFRTGLSGDELAERLDACAAAATFVSRVLLAPPAGPMLVELGGSGVLDEWPIESDPDTDAGLDAVHRSAAAPESLEALLTDHRRLFIGPDTLIACPYESVYLGVEHLTFGPETLAVRRWYQRYGLAAPAEGREPDDHIGLELAFVAHLCLQVLDVVDSRTPATASAADDAHDDQRLQTAVRALAEFLSDHLLLWADEFCGHLIAGAGTDFYRGVGHLTRGLLRVLERDFTA